MIIIDETVDASGQTRVMATRLGYLGLIPFAAVAVICWVQPQSLSYYAVAQWGLLYGAIILSFLGGAQWGAALQTGQYGRLVVAVLWSLLGWATMIPAGIIPGLDPALHHRFMILFVAFTMLLTTELLSRQWAGWYLSLRSKITVVVLALLFLSAMGLLYR